MTSLPVGSTEAAPEQTGLAFLSRATMVLLSSLDLATTLHQVASVAVPALGDFCACVVSTSDGWIHRASFADVGLHLQTTLPQWEQHWPLSEASDHAIVPLLRGGEPVFVPNVTDSWLETVATDSDHLQLLRCLEPKSFIAVPLVANSQVVGAFSACRTCASGLRYTSEDLCLASEFAQRAARAIANARRYRDEAALRMRVEAERTALQRKLAAIVGRDVVGGISGVLAASTESVSIKEIRRPRIRPSDIVAHDVKNALAVLHVLAQSLRHETREGGAPEARPLVDVLARIEAITVKITAMIDDLVH